RFGRKWGRTPASVLVKAVSACTVRIGVLTHKAFGGLCVFDSGRGGCRGQAMERVAGAESLNRRLRDGVMGRHAGVSRRFSLGHLVDVFFEPRRSWLSQPVRAPIRSITEQTRAALRQRPESFRPIFAAKSHQSRWSSS